MVTSRNSPRQFGESDRLLNMKQLFFLLYLSAAACTIGKVYVRNYLFAQKDTAVWIGEYLGRSYELSVLDSAGIWYNGRLVIAREDTLTLRGFEKGRSTCDHNDPLPFLFIICSS